MSPLPIDSQITFLYTTDLEKSAHFYSEILGLTLAVDQGLCRIYHVTGRKVYVGICEHAKIPVNTDSIIYTFVTQDVDAWYDQITSQGWECEDAPRLNETYNIYHFFVKDPSGYRLEIQRFAEANWDMSSD